MKLLIWDFDGTLAHRPGLWSGALVRALGEVDPDHGVTPEQIRPALQSGFRWHAPDKEHPVLSAGPWWAELHPVFERAYRAAGVDAALAQRLAGEVQRHYLAPSHWEVYPDTVPTLERLSEAGWQHALLTNHVPEFRELLSALDLGRHFLQVFNSAETGFEKPHPAAFRQVLNAFPAAGPVCMIGDSIGADVRGAASVGLPALLVRKEDSAARWGCPDLLDVPERLAELFA